MNQLIASAVAEKLSAFETAEFFEERARRADVATFDRIWAAKAGNRRARGTRFRRGIGGVRVSSDCQVDKF